MCEEDGLVSARTGGVHMQLWNVDVFNV